MPGQKSVPSFENGKCVFEVPVTIEDFINQFSVTYGKGAFILKGSFQGRTNYHIRTSVGTDMGICASINPVVSSIMAYLIHIPEDLSSRQYLPSF